MTKEDEDLVVKAQGSSWSSERSQDETPFFADMTLDLAEAHDIAVTPEATRKQFVTSHSIRDIPKMPSIPDDIGMEESSVSADAVPPFSQSLSAENSYDHNDTDGDNHNHNHNHHKQFFTSIANPISSRHRNHRALPSARRWPRDVKWAVAFWVVVPLSLLLPILFCPTAEQQQQQQSSSSSSMSAYSWMATAPAPRLATWHTLVWGYGASLVLSRLLYRTMGGGDGDDARHVASQILLLSAPISVSVYALLVVVLYALLPHAWLYLCVPLWYLARDVFLFRSWKMTATTPGGRQAFFQALTCMTLDILSRSLRRSSFYRIVSLLVIVQLVVIAWWRWALLAALKSHSMLWILVAALGGKWATGTVARLLTLIASGGIQRWFAEQDSLVQNSVVDGESPTGRNSDDNNDDDDEEDMIEFSTLNDNGYTQAYEDDPDDIPEAYRTADASMYKSALAADDGIDDDFDDELLDEDGAAVTYSSPISGSFPTSKDPQGSMVKQLLFQGLSRSFGSVAKCGLLGGNAQFLWSQIRKIDTARATFQNLQGMPIGHAQDDDMSIWSRYMLQANIIARSFVRNNSDMAMSHVAAFSKSYQRAAQDVAILIDESGVEPMIHEDISTHMSSCVGGSISGLIVVFTGFVLVHQRNKNHPQVEDSVVFLDMLMAFVFCYTLIFTVMEPLRASIKAVYVSFAQYPHALGQSFPLIYHRLKRMSESNLQ